MLLSLAQVCRHISRIYIVFQHRFPTQNHQSNIAGVHVLNRSLFKDRLVLSNSCATNVVKWRDHGCYENETLGTTSVDSLFQGPNPKFDQTPGTTNVIHS